MLEPQRSVHEVVSLQSSLHLDGDEMVLFAGTENHVRDPAPTSPLKGFILVLFTQLMK